MKSVIILLVTLALIANLSEAQNITDSSNSTLTVNVQKVYKSLDTQTILAIVLAAALLISEVLSLVPEDKIKSNSILQLLWNISHFLISFLQKQNGAAKALSVPSL
jgi:hypothetical protein